ncbi:dgpf domain protein [Renibacterium salmoninarum ATCC 33209]|uniref:Dgpf domain protein n=1 Tax=Renibacterium salmoninarum (strain ATCC 33209 / DSM 20767 / JCM 11484 / NBRC 15589 / NCIMB 2235) TaxID=288705 RepID=A9WQP2_RENSM|nr:YciI family protein [Renibacterium salmoninarum]ABY23599.1 dgpf domain protein [Renibacterium salmoninarum ATCC 33209]
MRYTLLLHYPEMSPEELGPEALKAGMDGFHAYASALEAAGVLLSAEVLQPSTVTTTLRSSDGELRIQDGPYVETKEQIGGTFVIEAPNLDVALNWAKQAPSIQWGDVEVHPTATRWSSGRWVGGQESSQN